MFDKIRRASVTGLMDSWRKRNSIINYDEVSKRVDQIRQPTEESYQPPRMSLPNLMGVFIILLTGYFTSLFVFGTERIVHCCFFLLHKF